MTYKPKPEELVEIELGGEQYRLFMPLREIRRLKEQHGLDLVGDPTKMETEPLGSICLILEAALKHEAPQMTVEEIEGVLHLGNIKYAVEKISQMMGSSDAPKQEPASAG